MLILTGSCNHESADPSCARCGDESADAARARAFARAADHFEESGVSRQSKTALRMVKELEEYSRRWHDDGVEDAAEAAAEAAELMRRAARLLELTEARRADVVDAVVDADIRAILKGAKPKLDPTSDLGLATSIVEAVWNCGGFEDPKSRASRRVENLRKAINEMPNSPTERLSKRDYRKMPP